MRQTFVTIHAEDEPGQLGRVAQALADAGVNIVAYNTFGGNAMLLPDNVDKCVSALDKHRIACTKTDVLAIEMPNTKGQLAKLGTDLGKAGINIEASFGAAGTNKTGMVYLLVDDIKAATPIVEKMSTSKTVTGTR